MNDQKKKWTPKTHWAKVLSVHADWLLEKGYTEKLLESKVPEGKLIEDIKEGIINAMAKCLFDYHLEQFVVETTGFFREGRDVVVFQFTYRVDPAANRLFLTSMKAALAGTTVEFPINDNAPGELLPAKLVYSQAATINTNILNNKLKKISQLGSAKSDNRPKL